MRAVYLGNCTGSFTEGGKGALHVLAHLLPGLGPLLPHSAGHQRHHLLRLQLLHPSNQPCLLLPTAEACRNCRAVCTLPSCSVPSVKPDHVFAIAGTCHPINLESALISELSKSASSKCSVWFDSPSVNRLMEPYACSNRHDRGQAVARLLLVVQPVRCLHRTVCRKGIR